MSTGQRRVGCEKIRREIRKITVSLLLANTRHEFERQIIVLSQVLVLRRINIDGEITGADWRRTRLTEPLKDREYHRKAALKVAVTSRLVHSPQPLRARLFRRTHR